MSCKQNTEWLEGAQQMFDEAVDMRNVTLAKEIISDTFDAGFIDEARGMALFLRELDLVEPLRN